MSLSAYRKLVPGEEIDALERIAQQLAGTKIQHLYSSGLDGSLTDMLDRSVALYAELGLQPRWTVLMSTERFFEAARVLQAGLLGGRIALTDSLRTAYLEGLENFARTQYLAADAVIVHDVAPLGLVRSRLSSAHWVWRCHINVSHAQRAAWNFLRPFASAFDLAVFSNPAFARRLPIPSRIMSPCIDPFSERNRDLGREEVDAVLRRLDLPTRSRLVVQLCNYDQWCSWDALWRVVRGVRKKSACELVLVMIGQRPGQGVEAVIGRLREMADPGSGLHLVELPLTAHHELNALEHAASVVVAPSTTQGLDLCVTEAMWNERPVVVGTDIAAGAGIRHGENGFVFADAAACGRVITSILKDPRRAAEVGRRARTHVQHNFLIHRTVRNWLDVLLDLKREREGSKRRGTTSATRGRSFRREGNSPSSAR